MVAVRHLGFYIFTIFVKNSNYRLFLHQHAKFGADQTTSVAELLRIFDFQNGGRPPSWIWYNVITDHPEFVFDGPNILLKLHVDTCLYFARYHSLYIRPVWLQIANSRPFCRSFWDITP